MERQEAALDEARARSATLLGIATVIASFVGGAALGRENVLLGPVGWVAVVLWAVTVLVTVDVLMPRERWRFLPEPLRVLDGWMTRQPPPSAAQIRYGLVDEMERAHRKNQPRIDAMYDAIQYAAILTLLQFVAWLVELAQ
jgi:hypothetical protein